MINLSGDINPAKHSSLAQERLDKKSTNLTYEWQKQSPGTTPPCIGCQYSTDFVIGSSLSCEQERAILWPYHWMRRERLQLATPYQGIMCSHCRSLVDKNFWMWRFSRLSHEWVVTLSSFIAEVIKSSLAAVPDHLSYLSISVPYLGPKYSYQLTTLLILRGGS